MKRHWRRLARLFVGLAATAAFLTLFAREVDIGQALSEFRGLPWWATVAGAAMVLVNLFFMSLRWRYLVRGAGYEVPLRFLARAAAVGQAGSNILPLRGGDVLRVESVRELGVPGFAVAGTLIAEKVLDGLALSAWIVIGALMLGQGGVLLLIGVALMAGSTLGIVVLGAASRHQEASVRLVARLGRRLPERWRGPLERAMAHFVAGLASLADRRNLLLALAASAGMWLADVVMYALVGWAYGLHMQFGAYFLLEGVANLALAIPAVAAGIGTFDYLTLLAAQAISMPADLAPAYVLTVHMLTVVPITLAGIIVVRRAFPRLLRGRSESARAAMLEVESLEDPPGGDPRRLERLR